MVSHPPQHAADKHASSARPTHSSTPTSEVARSRATRAKAPSKDGHVQRAASEVAGLTDYQLGDCLGKGAFGSVYRALNWGTGETVAIKQIRLADLPKSELRVIMTEIDLLKNLHDPNIVKYHGFVKSAENLYILLEYCENGSLHSICKNFGKFPENLVALYMSQVLHGLLYLHEQGVIHRDIKGANILTTKEGLVKLADFGVATKSTGLSESSVVGTPYWMAPEVIELSGATTASDIWSLGCTVIELLDGKPPYHKLQPMPALFRIVNDDHPPLPAGASPAVRDFLMQCFQKDPNLRVSAKKLLKHPWIVNARRTDAVVPTKPTKYDEAVKSVQQWNEALKSPQTNSFRRTSRALVSSSTPSSSGRAMKETAPATTKAAVAPASQPSGLRIAKTRPTSSHTRISQPIGKDDSDDNWDDDFASSISPSALKQLPQLKPHDNFGGIFSHERLKSMATVTEEPSSFAMDGEGFDDMVTVRGPIRLDQTVAVRSMPRPVSAGLVRERTKSRPSSRGSRPGSSSSKSSLPNTSSQRRPSSIDGEPRTQILRLPTKSPLPPLPNSSTGKTRLASLSKPTNLYRENTVEDYSDLIAENDFVFQNKIEKMKAQKEDSFSPKLFHPNDLQSAPRGSQQTTKARSMRRSSSYNKIPEPRDAIVRSNFQLQIHQYSEDAEDEDFSDIFDQSLKLRSKQKPESSDSGSDRSTLVLMSSKYSSNSWLGDEEDEEDPFAQLDEGFDELDLESNVARDRYNRLCAQVEGLIGSLKTSQPDDVLADLSEQLIELLDESPDLKSVIVSSHGMLPILEILETCPHRDVILRLLKIVNLIIFENVEIQENLCFVGGIPIVTQFAHKKYSSQIRLEAAAFVRQMYQTSTLTLQMFISCGGLNVLVEFLEEDLESERDLVLIGVNGVWSVFELQGPTPKNDFCRIFSRSSILYPLCLVLNKVLDGKDELSLLIQGRIVNIFLLFSQAENYVKELVADRMVLKRVLKDLGRMSQPHQITMLKFIKNLSMLATTHEQLQNSNAIEVLTDLLSSSRPTAPQTSSSVAPNLVYVSQAAQFRKVSNEVLNIMYNLCRLSKERQEDAALNGVIPLLMYIVQTEWPLKEFALPILCDMAHSGKVGRKILWQCRGLGFYVGLLGDRYWSVVALDAIFIWLQEETARVEAALLSNSFPTAITSCFTNPDTSADAFENLLEPLQKLLRLSPPIAACLANPDVFSRTVQKLHTRKAVVRVNLLRIVRSIVDASDETCPQLIKAQGLLDAVESLAMRDEAVLVRQMASDLVCSCENASTPGGGRRSFDFGSLAKRLPGSRRTSHGAAMMGTPTGYVGSQPPTPQRRQESRERVDRLGAGDVFDLGQLSLVDASSVRRTPYRPQSRDGSGGSASSFGTNPSLDGRPATGNGVTGTSSSSGSASSIRDTRSKLPRTSGRVGGRLSLATSGLDKGGKSDGGTPGTPSGRGLAVRRRRQTSGHGGQ